MMQRNTIWITCDGENPADVENLGAVHYYPRRGFPSYYFPYLNVDGYMPPLVAVQFENPKRECPPSGRAFSSVQSN